MGRNKNGKRSHGAARSQKVNYKVVQQSYEDKDYEEAKPVLVPTAVIAAQHKRRQPMMQLLDEVPEDYTTKRNMNMADDMDDEEHDRIFGDEVEEDFDQDWIKQMMTGEGVEGEFDDEEFEEMDEDELAAMRKASKHDVAEFDAKERQFARMMNEFNMDEDIEEEDPRVQGPLEVEAYAEALKTFAEDNAGTTWADEGEATRHKGLINQLAAMSRAHNVFDSNQAGRFYAVAADKGARIEKSFKEEHQQLVELTKAQVARGELADAIDEENEDDLVTVEIKKPKHERMDCETIVSTYSTLYNRPNIIAAEKGKLKLKRGREASQQDLAKLADEEAEEDDEDAPLDFEALREELSTRPKKETPEEKKKRRALVKQLQAERRQQKKQVKNAYQEVGTAVGASRKTSKTAKAQTQLSLVRGVATQ